MRPRISLVCTVWGAQFTDFFCRYALASLLTPTNLPEASAAYDFTLLLYTSEDDLLRMQGHPNFRSLSEIVEIKPVLLETLPSGAWRGHWIQWHHALLNTNEFSSFILLIPDCVYANRAIAQIADLLNTKDIVYYCIPQVCLEPTLPYLDSIIQGAKDPGAASQLDLSDLDIASLFVRYVTPRYAVAAQKPTYFVTHPEFALQAKQGKIEVHELTCHALAISNRAKNVSYTFNPNTPSAEIGFLGLLAVGVEYTFKYFEQYFRWASSNMQLSRYSTLASWSHHYFAYGASEYSGTTTQVSVSGLAASALERQSGVNGRTKYGKAILEFNAALFAIYACLPGSCPEDVRRAIALAICLPGFRKAAMSERRPLTLLLPISGDVTGILETIYTIGDPQRVLRLLLMHALPGRLLLKVGQSFVFEQVPGQPAYRPRFRVIEAELSHSLSDIVTGRVSSPATMLTDDLIAYFVDIRYGAPDAFVKNFLESDRSVIADNRNDVAPASSITPATHPAAGARAG